MPKSPQLARILTLIVLAKMRKLQSRSLSTLRLLL
ncbi:unnamed protein product [Strongylus vulgaris]|uniref:Uncharacterized protein n=1 Tax=Strongylus vulgaris TaxID=40348 RepID=A0A3P7KYP1_STRVU|nr:unnamed protein product [Strongylus vulgaris]